MAFFAISFPVTGTPEPLNPFLCETFIIDNHDGYVRFYLQLEIVFNDEINIQL